MNKFMTALAGISFALFLATNAFAADSIKPGERWLDTEGKHIQAHGGGIIKLEETYFWFGEDRARENPRDLRCVSCYSSTNLLDWTHRGQVLALENPENFKPD